MIGKTISHYKILEELGEGGMGIVYKAGDTKIKRTVALKFLRGEAFRDEEQKARFVREAQTAAALDHPNICTIFEIDEVEDRIFISMAFIEGVDLKQKIEAGSLEIAEALDITVQAARGVAAAHKRGIIHRDIKSSNIMVTGSGQVKIMDFGLAKILGDTEISKTTLGIGTPSYMSTEQAWGDAVDHRTDIWSLGVCLYEMLTGELPFKGGFDSAVVYSILNQDPKPVREIRPSIPVELEAILNKMLAKDPDDRYQEMSDLIVHLESPAKARHLIQATRPPPGMEVEPSIAVMPFADMSPKKDQEYFCDGMAEEVINALTKVEGLNVVSRTSSFSYKGQSEDVRKIGLKLNAGTILEGSVRKAGRRLRITTQLINVVDGYHLWSEQYDRELEDVFAIQEEIARNIVQALQVELTDKEERTLGKAATRDVLAYDFYLRGREFFTMSRKRNLKRAIDMFSRAIKQDRKYALAYAGKADCFSFIYMQVDCKESNLEYAMRASEKALELDPELAEAHAARGVAVSLSGSFEEAEREFETAIRLNPKLFEAHYFSARNSYVQGKLEEAVESYERACQVNPGDFQAPVLLSQTYRGLNLPEKAEAALRRGLVVVEKHLELNPDDARAYYFGANCLAAAGEQEKALDWAKRAVEIDTKDPLVLYGVACVYSQLGKVQEAIDLVEGALKAGFAHKKWMEIDSDLDSIRDHPRFKALLEKL